MVNIEYSNAYREVLEILKYISKDDYNKIPREKIKLFEANANNEYNFEYDQSKTLNQQNISKIAKGMIAILFRDCWATDEQRQKILAKESYDRIKIEEEKLKQYNPDDLFKDYKKDNINKVERVVENNQKEEMNLVEYKKIFFLKYIIFLKEFFANRISKTGGK